MCLKTKLFLICIFLTKILGSTSAHSKVFAQFSPDTTTIELFPYIEIYADQGRTLTFDDIIRGEPPIAFKPASDVGNSFGFSKASYWVHFSDNQYNSSKNCTR